MPSAAQMLALIGELYAIEREAKEAHAMKRRVGAAQERSVPVLARIKSGSTPKAKSSCRAARWPRRSPTPRTSGRR